MNHLYNLPYELVREIYEYDNTYRVFFNNCINELKYLQKTYPIQLTRVNYYSQNIYSGKIISVYNLPNYKRFIFDYCNRKKSLRSYKNRLRNSFN